MTASKILKCSSCGSYALKEQCPCGARRISPKPPKYGPEDKYANYRRKYKEMHPGAAAKTEAKTEERKLHPLEAKRRGLEGS